MAECNKSSLVFSSLGRKKIHADFGGGHLTSDAGGLLLREVDKRLGLIDALAGGFSDRRDPAKTRHALRTLLAQGVFAIALGYEDLNDHDQLRPDPLMQPLSERPFDPEHPLASASTLCRWENRIDRATLVRMASVFVQQFTASQKQPPQQLVLDFDATDDPVHGQQEGRFFHGYYDHNVYFCPGTSLENWPDLALLRSAGADNHSVFRDPLFVDWEKRNFTLKPGSPALKLGIQQGDISAAGLIDAFPDEWR